MHEVIKSNIHFKVNFNEPLFLSNYSISQTIIKEMKIDEFNRISALTIYDQGELICIQGQFQYQITYSKIVQFINLHTCSDDNWQEPFGTQKQSQNCKPIFAQHSLCAFIMFTYTCEQKKKTTVSTDA